MKVMKYVSGYYMNDDGTNGYLIKDWRSVNGKIRCEYLSIMWKL